MKEEPAIEELERDIKEQVFLLGLEKLFDLLGKTKKISSFDLFVLFFKRKMQFNVSCDKYSICKLGIPLSGETSEFVDDLIEEALIEIKQKNSRAKYVGRIASASPATGYGSYHAKEQKNLIDEALN